jgi:hypothetical protein
MTHFADRTKVKLSAPSLELSHSVTVDQQVPPANSRHHSPRTIEEGSSRNDTHEKDKPDARIQVSATSYSACIVYIRGTICPHYHHLMHMTYRSDSSTVPDLKNYGLWFYWAWSHATAAPRGRSARWPRLG